MMLHWRGLEHELIAFLQQQSTDRCYIFAPFIQPRVLERILADISVGATVVTSWREDHLRAGVSSIETYDICAARQDTALYVNSRLHAKVYACDLSRNRASALLGSANVSELALSDGPDSNHEVLAYQEHLATEDQVQLHRLLYDSSFVTQEMAEAYREWLEAAPASASEPLPALCSGAVQLLITYLPLSDNPARLWQLASGAVTNEQWWEHDAMIHDLAMFHPGALATRDEFISTVRRRFLAQPFVAQFLAKIDGEGMFFGRIKEWLQRNCTDVPTPRRRDLTFVTQALIDWTVALQPSEFEVIKPRHSECLRRRAHAP